MTDHKFTDDDVIKALELCSKLDFSFEECDKCPYKGECGTKEGNMPADAFALIKRQKRKIEELEEIIFMDRSEAIKEFAQRLKADIVETGDEHGLGNSYPILTHNYIDNLVKEMTEETK